VSLWRNYYDIVILPPPEVVEHAIALSKQLERYGGKFVLGKRRFLPHVSLYHIPVRPERFAEFCKVVRRVVSQHRGGMLQLKSVEMPVVMTTKPKWLERLHLDLVESTSPFLDREYGVEKTWSTEYLPAKLRRPAQRYLEKFGSPMIAEVFRPHITLTSFKDKSVKPPRLEFEKLAFEVHEVTICQLGVSHTCHRKLATHDLAADYADDTD
jgi:hypothetical protein